MASTATTAFFVGIVLVVAALGGGAVLRAGRALREPPRVTARWVAATIALLALWLAATGLLAASGRLASFATFPPPVLLLAIASVALTLALACSPFGTRLASGVSVVGLVGYQAFRVPLEMALFLLHREGVVPVQMTFEGRNFDILTGVSALLVAWLAARGKLSARGLLVWNSVGFALLVNIVVVAALSTPVPFRVFFNDPPNTFITRAPFVWLPTVLVQAALFGHVLVFRRLLSGYPNNKSPKHEPELSQ